MTTKRFKGSTAPAVFATALVVVLVLVLGGVSPGSAGAAVRVRARPANVVLARVPAANAAQWTVRATWTAPTDPRLSVLSYEVRSCAGCPSTFLGAAARSSVGPCPRDAFCKVRVRARTIQGVSYWVTRRIHAKR
jgi:hypothetical protein